MWELSTSISIQSWQTNMSWGKANGKKRFGEARFPPQPKGRWPLSMRQINFLLSSPTKMLNRELKVRPGGHFTYGQLHVMALILGPWSVAIVVSVTSWRREHPEHDHSLLRIIHQLLSNGWFCFVYVGTHKVVFSHHLCLTKRHRSAHFRRNV